MKITPLFSLSPFTYSRYWSILATKNGAETASSIIVNSHHVTHAVYAFKKDDLFAITTFKDRKDLNQVKNLFGKDVMAEPLPKNTRTETEIIRNNKTFMRNNFENIVEIN